MFNKDTRKISCLSLMGEVLGLDDLKSFHMLIFTCDGLNCINISAFDEQPYEIVFPETPTYNGNVD